MLQLKQYLEERGSEFLYVQSPYKINKYDEFTLNPFEVKQSLILIWVEEDDSDWVDSEKTNL